ncbi:MAG: YCF48-related protein [candidate division KSB1 bacterium]|nr:YCF48-related protein [candidate division KSB1 bacterium]
MGKRYFQIVFVSAAAMLFATNSLLFSQSWTSQPSGTVNILEAVWFKDAQNGWAVGNSGTSIFTVNGGQSWSSVNLTNDDLKDVAFFDQSLGLIVGDNGRIFRTTNGGTNWSAISSGTTSNILAVAFGSGGVVYAAGRDGLILRSSDSGASWTVVETGTTRFRAAAAIGSQNAWVVGDGGKIRATTNGGNSWSDLASGTSSDLHDVFFLTVTEGWVAGQNDVLRYTNDGGITWSSRNTGITVGLEGVYFLNSNQGWAVGHSGQIFVTNNGGLSWAPEPSGTTQELNDVFFFNAAHGWAVGDNGTILHRATITGMDDGNVDSKDLPAEFSLEQNYPNPFNPETTIRFAVPKTAQIKFEIYNLLGQRVRVLVDGQLPSGYHTAKWDGRDDAGRLLSSGFYFYRITTDDFSATKRLLFLK